MVQAVRKGFAADADSYDRARRRAVPCFDDFYRTALELLPFAADDRFELLDLGASTGLLSAMIAEAFPNALLTLFDLTPEMLTIARQRLKPLGKRVKFVTADFAKAAPSKPYDAVVSALAIHHLPDSGKRHLFADIFKYLTPGGFSSTPIRWRAKAPRSTSARARCGSNARANSRSANAISTRRWCE